MRKMLPWFLLVTATGLSSLALAGEASLDELQTQIQACMERISPSRLGKSTAAKTKGEDEDVLGTKVEKTRRSTDVSLGKSASSLEDTRIIQARLLLQQSSDDVKYLQTLSASQNLSEDYRKSLVLSKDMLGSLSLGEAKTESGFQRLMLVSADLRTKAEHAQRMSSAAFKSVDVTVHTRKQGQEVSGYEVWYAPAAFGDGSHDLRFEKYSSPTGNQLAPGNYLIWARNAANGTNGNRQRFPIGQGKTSHDIDIDAP